MDLRKSFADFQKREKKSRQLTDDAYDDFVDELGGEDQLEAYTFDGTVGDAQRILKEHKDYHDYMYQQYKMGKLEPRTFFIRSCFFFPNSFFFCKTKCFFFIHLRKMIF